MRVPDQVLGDLFAQAAAAAVCARRTQEFLDDADVSDLTALSADLQDRADRAVFSGNVHARQADLLMDAARVTVAYTGGSGGTQIQRLDASGGVKVTSPSETATGQFAIYDLNRRLITMLGGVTLVRGESHVSGGRLVIDLNSGRATVDGSAVGGAGNTTGRGGRVTGRFTVPQRNP